MAYPTFSAGQILTAAQLTAMQWKSIEQNTDQTVTNSTVLVDSNLIITVESGATYRYWALIAYETPSTADIQFAWASPSNGVAGRWTWGIGTAASGTDINSYDSVAFRRPASTTAVEIGAAQSTHTLSYYEAGILEGGSGGDFTFQFAQNAAASGDTILRAFSRVEYVRIG